MDKSFLTYKCFQVWWVLSLVLLFLHGNYMFIKQNVNVLQKFKVIWKSNWFAAKASEYRRYIYEDVFIRKYLTSFFFKWSKVHRQKVIGSIYLFRTLGKLYISVFFFYPPSRVRVGFLKKEGLVAKQLFKFSKNEVRPVIKCKKQLSFLSFFYQLERILNVQVFFKLRNICNSVYIPSVKVQVSSKILVYLVNKLSHFRHQFKEEVYLNTILVLVHLFKFKKPDSLLLANYIAFSLMGVHKHTHFLLFLKKTLQVLYKILNFNGVRILFSGKLNSFSRAQSKQTQVGQVSFQSYDLPFSYGHADSFTKAGKIGVKVWVC